MGCFSSTKKDKKNSFIKKNTNDNSNDQNSASKIQSLFDHLKISEKDFQSDLNNSFFDDGDKFEDEIDEFYEKYRKSFKSNQISKSELMEYIKQLRLKVFLSDQLQYKKWEVHSFLREIIPSVAPNNENNINKVFQNLEISGFPENQLGINYNYTERRINNLCFKVDELTNFLNSGNLKLEFINIRFLYEEINDEKLIQSVCNILKNHQEISTLTLSLEKQNKNEKLKNLINLERLFNQIILMENLKFFCMRIINQEPEDIPLSLSNRLKEIICLKSLQGFYISKLRIFTDVFIEIGEIISKSENIKFFGIENVSSQMIEGLVTNLSHNSKICLLILGGNIKESETIQKFRSLLNQNESLLIFHYLFEEKRN